jgi:hypothetical protein
MEEKLKKVEELKNRHVRPIPLVLNHLFENADISGSPNETPKDSFINKPNAVDIPFKRELKIQEKLDELLDLEKNVEPAEQKVEKLDGRL